MNTNLLRKGLPLAVTAAGAIYFVVAIAKAAMPPAPSAAEFNLRDFSTLPVVDRGRVQPLDSVARVNLLIINNRQDFVEKQDGDKRQAMEWLLDVMVNGFLKDKSRAADYPIFRIENDQLLSSLKLPYRAKFLRYSFNEFKDSVPWIESESKRVAKIPVKERTALDVKALELAGHVHLYLNLAFLEAPLLIPPLAEQGEWLSFRAAYEEENPLIDYWARMLKGYIDGNPVAFNNALKEYRQYLDEKLPKELADARFETFFNRLEPFNKSAHMYITVFALAVLGWLRFGWSKEITRAAFGLALATFILHTGALVMRMMIQGRPPVTNLYSSAVFIGWGCVICGLTLDWIFKNGLGIVASAVLGGCTLIIAQHLAQSGDTLEMMQAVLDTNFWLATHVTIVTFGYVATFVAGLFGLMYILLGVCTPLLVPDLRQQLSKMIYGVICFATLLSFVGTVLGGIWADQSWGRFWGWDPKENGALMIVIWNALVLHARWAGMIKQRGMAALAVGGNIITAWSWFGVNMLGVGLHSYGFIPGAVLWMMIFVGSQLAIIGIGLLPTNLWWSNAAPLSPAPPYARPPV